MRSIQETGNTFINLSLGNVTLYNHNYYNQFSRNSIFITLLRSVSNPLITFNYRSVSQTSIRGKKNFTNNALLPDFFLPSEKNNAKGNSRNFLRSNSVRNERTPRNRSSH